MSAVEALPLLEAGEPPEERGLGRDDVALLVASRHDGRLRHARFRELSGFLRAGDLLVVNTSATIPAAIPARLDERTVELRLSSALDDGRWLVELRTSDRMPFRRPPVGARLDLPGGASAELLAAYAGGERLALARLELPWATTSEAYLRDYGRPIRYGYVAREWPIDAYQTVFAVEPGSAEMPSAGRPFTGELVGELVARGVQIAPVTLHTGVSSLELGEAPYPERYRVPLQTARLVNATRGWGGRVIAVGTSVTRAVETVAGADGRLLPGEGWTSLVITPQRGLRAIDGLLTGWHEPEASHRRLLEASAGSELLARSYRAARARGYRWHEFGDSHLILP